MKKLILIAVMSLLLMHCYTHQNLSTSGQVRSGMTPNEVLKIMGEPIVSELDKNVETWHYCNTADGLFNNDDTYLALFFVDNNLIAKTFYTQDKEIGSCENFVKKGNYKVPLEVQAILDAPADSKDSN